MLKQSARINLQRLIFLNCLCLGVSTTFSAAARDARDQTAPLFVMTAFPRDSSGEIDPPEYLQISFNSPIVAIISPSDQPAVVGITIDPPIKGGWRWIGTDAIEFRPETTFQINTEYRVSIDKGFCSAISGKCLQQAFSWKFRTRRFYLESFIDLSDTGLAQKAPLYMEFNQGLDVEACRRALTILPLLPFDIVYADSSECRRLGMYHRLHGIDQKYQDRIVKIIPKESWKRGTTYSFAISKSLKPLIGNLGLGKDTVFARNTVGDLLFNGMEQFSDEWTAIDSMAAPENPLCFCFSNHIDWKKQWRHVNITPKIAFDSADFSGRGTRFCLHNGLKAMTKYSMTFDPGLTDIFGNRLGAQVVKYFLTGSYAPFVRMLDDDWNMESHGHRMVPVYYCNKGFIELDLIAPPMDAAIKWRRNKDTFGALLEQANREGWQVCRIRAVQDTARNRQHLWKLPLDTILHGKPGFVAARLLKPNETASYGKRRRTSLTATFSSYMVSNIGLTIQEGNGKYCFYATQLDKGVSLPGATITVYDYTGQLLWSANTDRDGRALLPSTGNFRIKLGRKEQSSPYVIVTHDNEWSFKPLYEGYYCRPSGPELPIFATAFTDRGLYLPGDTVRFSAILRADDDSLVIPRQCRVRLSTRLNSYHHSDTVTVSDVGSVSYALPVPQDAELGQYTISGNVMGNDSSQKTRYENNSFSASFIVGEFRANSVVCNLTCAKDTFFTGDTVAVRVVGRYLYDAPFALAKGRIILAKEPYSFFSALFKGYSFDLDKGERGRHTFKFDSVLTCMLDSSGRYDFKVPLIDTLFRGGYVYEFNCDFSSAHDNVSASKKIVVHPGSYYIGLKPHAYYGAVGKAHLFDVATVTISGEPIAVKNLLVTVFRHSSHSIETADESGAPEDGEGAQDIENSVSDSLVLSTRISTNASGAASFSFKPRKSGDYSVIISGTPRSISSSVGFTAVQKKYNCIAEGPDFALHVDKTEYEVGDTMRLFLSNVLRKGKALVTTERDHVFTTGWFDIAPNRPEIKIPILPVHRSGFWISVAAYYGGKTVAVAVKKQDELRGPQWRTDRLFVKVSWWEKSLKMKLIPDKAIYAPGDEVVLECSIPHLQQSKHEVIVWAEDDGVLSLTGYKPPDILDKMYSQREHGVSLSDTRESLLKPFRLILEERISEPKFIKGGALGGSHAHLMATDLSEDAKARKRFSMCPLFASSVHMDAQGRKTIRFRIPDNLTRFRIMALAATDDGRFGNADTSIIVTKPFFVRPMVPQCLRNRDTVRIGVLVENRTDSAASHRILFTGKGLAFVQPASAHMDIAPGSRKEFFAAAVVDGMIDTVRMIFKVVSARDSDAVVASVPVTPFRFRETVTACGIIDKKKYEKIRRPLQHDLDRSMLSIEATNTIVQGLKGSLEYLNNYPYDCAEQMTSMILPYLLCGDIFKKEAVNSFTDSLIHDKVETYLRVLPQYATGLWGGFSYWKGGVESNPYLTAYILFSLYRAIDCGYNVQSEMLNDCFNGLVRYLRNPESKKENDWYARQCYVASVLSEYNRYQLLPLQSSRLMDSLIRELLPLHAKGSLFAQVNILRTIRSRNDAAGLCKELMDHIRSGVIHEPLYAYFDEPVTPASQKWHQTPIRTTALILQTFLEMNEDLLASDKIVRWLLLQKSKEGHWGTTQNNVYALWALCTYARMKEPPARTCTAEISLDRKPIIRSTFKGGSKGERVEWQQPFSAFPGHEEHSLLFKKSGTGIFYYTLRMDCLPLKPVLPFDAGFRMETSYTTLDGRPVSLDSLRYREIVLVKTTVSTPRERRFVVVSDPVPAGCEIINEAFNTVERAVKEGIRSKKKDFYFSWSTWNHFEYRKEGCRVYATRLHAGAHRFTYAIRPIARGTFHLPPAHVEEMYSPEVYGRSGERMAVVR
jgi:alpha-2-macroglobulin